MAHFLTTKICLVILLSGFYSFPCKLVIRIWCKIKIKTFTWLVWVFSLPACWIMSGYYREKLHVNHLWDLKLHLTSTLLKKLFSDFNMWYKSYKVLIFFSKFKLELTQEIIQKYLLSHDQMSETINKLS